jgi:hypothetical protein
MEQLKGRIIYKEAKPREAHYGDADFFLTAALIKHRYCLRKRDIS